MKNENRTLRMAVPVENGGRIDLEPARRRHGHFELEAEDAFFHGQTFEQRIQFRPMKRLQQGATAHIHGELKLFLQGLIYQLDSVRFRPFSG